MEWEEGRDYCPSGLRVKWGSNIPSHNLYSYHSVRGHSVLNPPKVGGNLEQESTVTKNWLFLISKYTSPKEVARWKVPNTHLYYYSIAFTSRALILSINSGLGIKREAVIL